MSVGVVIPCKDYEEFLPFAVLSIPPDVPVVVVDDGSAYRVSVLVAAHPAPVVRLDTTRGGTARGVGIARNVGAAYLDTAYLLFLDADDWLHPNALEVLLKTLQEHKDAAFAYGNYTESGKTVVPPEWDARLLERQNVASYCNLWRRDAFWSIGGYSDCPVAEDWELQRRAARAGLSGARVDALVFEHRIHQRNKWTRDIERYGGLGDVSAWLQKQYG